MSAEFDEFACKYEKTMERSCALSGESPDFYAVERLRWLERRLRDLLPFETILDFGCGTGGSIPHFFDILRCRNVIGIDPSEESLRVAQQRSSRPELCLSTPGKFIPSANIPLAFCNGVFHHIPVPQRLETLEYIRACLTPNGLFAFWENNPWNPIVVYGMKLNEFDRNAETLSPTAAIRLLKAAGFRIKFIDFCFFFPHAARKCRGLESALTWLPLGAQYVVLAYK